MVWDNFHNFQTVRTISLLISSKVLAIPLKNSEIDVGTRILQKGS